MASNPDNLDVICSQLSPSDKAEYDTQVVKLQKDLDEYWSFEIVPNVFKQSLLETDETKFNYLDDHFGRINSWDEIITQLNQLNAGANDDEVYKLLFLSRHGAGYHNQAHAKYGNKLWNEYWSKLNGDGEIVWGPDPELNALGKSQAHDNYLQWEKELNDEPLIKPLKWYSSPFKRSIDTFIGTFQNLFDIGELKPLILENLRETIGVHTCDKRSTKSEIVGNYKSVGFEIEPNFEEEDVYWKSDVRELIAEQAIRINKSFQFIFNDSKKDESIISITSHSGSIRAQLLVLGHRPFAVVTGGIIPVFVKATKNKT